MFIGAETFGNHKVRIQNFKGSSPEEEPYAMYVYEYIIESETPLSELETFPNCKET